MTSSENNRSNNFNFATKAWLTVAGLVTVGLISGVGAFAGAQLANGQKENLSPIELHAATASHNDSVSMATGLITSEVEGLWTLDHESGQLQCWVLSPRSGAFAGSYSTNVANDLELNKGKPEFLMTTGNFFYTGGKIANQSPARSVCYVANTTSGVVAGYSLGINEQRIARGQAQGGQLTKICTGKIKEQAVTREQ